MYSQALLFMIVRDEIESYKNSPGHFHKNCSHLLFAVLRSILELIEFNNLLFLLWNGI